MTAPEIVQRGVPSLRVYGARFLVSDFVRASAAERATVDAWVVATGHSLAMQPGSPEHRYVVVVRELATARRQNEVG